jgi:hypothetical protein
MELYFAEMRRGFEGLQGRVDFTGPAAESQRAGERPETGRDSI